MILYLSFQLSMYHFPRKMLTQRQMVGDIENLSPWHMKERDTFLS